MDRRLEEAAHAGDVNALHELLEQDRLLLHRPNIVSNPTDNPLQVAALLGHSEFAREILARNPNLARAVNGRGLSPLHLASANGHLLVVKELLSIVGSDLCLLCDKDGLLPIHTAAINGGIHVLEELMRASSESVYARTCLGDTVLHLAVKYNRFEAVEFLVEKLDQMGDHEFLMSGDAEGNTILHLATARKQLKIVKLLLSKPWVNVNAVNSKGSTILDVLLESPFERGDLMLGEMIRAAGGRTSETNSPTPSNLMLDVPIEGTGLRRRLLLFVKYPLALIGLGRLFGIKRHDDDDKKYVIITPDTLIIVATLVATIAFQAAMNPPGGFAQKDDEGKVTVKGEAPSHNLVAGQALVADELHIFLVLDILALLTSLLVIMMLICFFPRRKGPLRFLMWMTWFAVLFMVSAFRTSFSILFPHTKDFFYPYWNVAILVFYFWIWVRFIQYVRMKTDWLHKLIQVQVPNPDRKKVTRITRIFAGILIVLALLPFLAHFVVTFVTIAYFR